MADPWTATVAALLGATRPRAPDWTRPLEPHEVVARHTDLLALVDRGVSSPADLAAALDIHPATLHSRLRRLAERGVLQRTERGQWQRTSKERSL